MNMQHSTVAGYANVFPLRDTEWDDIRIPVSAARLGASKPPVRTAYKGGEVLAFEDQAVLGNEQRVTFSAQLPHGYKEGTDIEAHVHWVGEDQTAGNVVWELTASWANIDAAMPAEDTFYGVASNNTVLADAHNYDDLSPNLSGTGKEISGMLLCTLRRNSSNVADTLTGKSAYLLEVDFHFQMDTLGSQEETTKN